MDYRIISGLSYSESTGLDSIAAEHIRFADPQLVVLLSIPVSSLCTLLKTRIEG